MLWKIIPRADTVQVSSEVYGVLDLLTPDVLSGVAESIISEKN